MRWFALLTLSVLAAVGCAGSNSRERKTTGTIAFVRANHLLVMRADGSGQRVLTSGRNLHHPAWSPGRRTIAFGMWDKDTHSDLYVINADGSGLRRLTRHTADTVEAVWSPDGRRIALDEYYDGTYMIFVVKANGGGERRVTPGLRFSGPTWSRDGRRIAFVSGAVYVANRDGSGRRVLARTKTTRSVAWSPDGRLIAFASDDGIETVNADGSGRRMLVPSPASEIVWSPDSRTIAFSGDGGIFVVNPDGSGLRNLTDNGASPVWSPDGRAIAFTSERDGNSEVYVMDADGSDQSNVSQSPEDDFSPAWSPKD